MENRNRKNGKAKLEIRGAKLGTRNDDEKVRTGRRWAWAVRVSLSTGSHRAGRRQILQPAGRPSKRPDAPSASRQAPAQRPGRDSKRHRSEARQRECRE